MFSFPSCLLKLFCVLSRSTLGRHVSVGQFFLLEHILTPHPPLAVSESKALCHPSSVDSLSTSAATEDHVSMGGWAARKALRVIEHVEQGNPSQPGMAGLMGK